MHRIVSSTIIGTIIGALVAFIIIVQASVPADFSMDFPYEIKTSHAASLAGEFGVVGALSSLSSDSSKDAAISKITGAGFGWMRNEITYADSIDFTPYDAAISKAKAAGLKVLVLLAYPGSGKSHDDWKNYVNTVVSRYASDVSAWEIMNEADNYLSTSDYTTYLSEARDIIKNANSSATIVASGVTSRQEATNFWNGIAAAGGWSYFDVVGLHVYHDGNPEKVNFGGGDLVAELDRVAGNINKNGGGKKIWITEMGYESGSVGGENQAKWLARSLVMLRSVSKLERIFLYRLYDGSGDSYGLTSSSFGEKASYSAVKTAISELSGKGIGTQLTPQQKTTLADFSSVSSWSTEASSNASVTLSQDASGYSGQAMKIAYNFSADSAYAIAEKSIAISGTPTALAAWFYGDDSKNVWKFRFKDANGETFQADLGSISSSWSYKQFTLATDTAFTSWGGNGTIDFPISFNSIVIDRQGGVATAEGKVDEIVAITGSADLYAYQFGSMVAYWKASGSDTATLCNATRQFTEDVQYASNVNCTDTPTASESPASSSSTGSSSGSTTSSSSSSAAKKKSTIATTPAPPKIEVDKTKSYIRLDGTEVQADGTKSYSLVIGVKQANDTFITTIKPEISASDSAVSVKDVILIGNEWIAQITSTKAGEYTISVKVGEVELGSVKAVFVPPLSREEKPDAALNLPSAKPTVPEPITEKDYSAIILVTALISVGSISTVLAKRLLHARKGT